MVIGHDRKLEMCSYFLYPILAHKPLQISNINIYACFHFQQAYTFKPLQLTLPFYHDAS